MRLQKQLGIPLSSMWKFLIELRKGHLSLRDPSFIRILYEIFPPQLPRYISYKITPRILQLILIAVKKRAGGPRVIFSSCFITQNYW